MAGNYSTHKGFITSVPILQSTGGPRAKGEDFKTQIQQGLKNCFRPYPNQETPYIGTVMALTFQVGAAKLYYDLLVDDPDHKKYIDMLSLHYIETLQDNARSDDIRIDAWNCWVISNKEIFLKIKTDVKEGKRYDNVVDIGATKSDVEFKQKMAEGFNPASPFAVNPVAKARPATPAPIVAPAAIDAPAASFGAAPGASAEEIPF